MKHFYILLRSRKPKRAHESVVPWTVNDLEKEPSRRGKQRSYPRIILLHMLNLKEVSNRLFTLLPLSHLDLRLLVQTCEQH